MHGPVEIGWLNAQQNSTPGTNCQASFLPEPRLFRIKTARWRNSPLQFLQPARDFLRVGAAVERADAEITFALRAETGAGRDDHVRVAENSVERLPARDSPRRARPEVRRVHAAENFQAGLLRAVAQNFRVAEIMFDQCLDLRFAVRRVERFGGALEDIARAVKFRRHAPRPERMQRFELAGFRLR